MKILETRENSLLKRKEIFAVINAEKTPSLEQVKEMLAEKEKAEKELIVVKEIKGSFGKNDFLIKAFIYHDKKSLEETEPKPKAKKVPGQPAQQPASA